MSDAPAEINGLAPDPVAPTATENQEVEGGDAAPLVIRVQDKRGRGPWRPGFSHKWVSDGNPLVGPPIYLELPKAAVIVGLATSKGMHVGCAVRANKINLWFTDTEIQRLKCLGFSLVNASSCTVLAETKTQVLIGSPLPLSHLPTIPSCPEPGHE